MESIMTYENNPMVLPNELIKLILDKLNDDDLIMRFVVPELTPLVIELLKERLERLSMRNLIRLYIYENVRNFIQQSFYQLSSLKYKEIKDIYQSETDQIVRNSIESFIADNFVEILGQAVPEGMDLSKQIDTIRAVLITEKFINLVDENGGLFHLFSVFNGTVERKMISIDINLVSTTMVQHSYQLNISVGSTSHKILIARDSMIERGSMIESECEYNFNNIFLRLYESIIHNYSLIDMKINTKTVGNNAIGQLNEEFNV